MGKAHERILEIAVTADESADTLDVTGVTWYQNRDELDASNGFTVAHTADAAAGTVEFEFGEGLPPPTHIRLVSTFQA